jgi:hypothetical protein
MTTLEENNGKIESQLATWGAKLDELVAATRKAGADTKVGYQAQLDDLKAKHQAARTKFTELKAAGSKDLETFTTTVGNAWGELETGFKKLTS